jgi:hypothetical protein
MCNVFLRLRNTCNVLAQYVEQPVQVVQQVFEKEVVVDSEETAKMRKALQVR